MWVLRAVRNRSYKLRSLKWIILLALIAESSYAQRSKTVGDILEKIEKKSESLKVRKKKSSLPQFQRTRSKKVNLKKVKPPSTSILYYAENTDEGDLERVIDEGIEQLFELKSF